MDPEVGRLERAPVGRGTLGLGGEGEEEEEKEEPAQHDGQRRLACRMVRPMRSSPS